MDDILSVHVVNDCKELLGNYPGIMFMESLDAVALSLFEVVVEVTLLVELRHNEEALLIL